MPRPPRSRCAVCKMAGSPRDPLYDVRAVYVRTGETHTVAVHAGGCAAAMAPQYQPITKETQEMAEQRGPATGTPPPGVDPATGQIGGDPPADPQGSAEGMAAAAAAAVETVKAEVVDLSTITAPVGITTQQVVGWIVRNEPLPESNPADVARSIALEILLAPSFDEAITGKEVTHAKDMLYRTLTVHGVKWQPSDFTNEGSPVYAVMDTEDAFTHERQLVLCGGLNVVAALVKADLEGAWPIRIKITSTPTGENGQQNVYRFEKAEPVGQETLDLDSNTF